MTGLDIFALIVLIILIAAVVGGWALLGMMPGKIARKRNHPQAEAINMCGWWGAITMGILSPLAYIWAYTKPMTTQLDSQALVVDSSKQEEEEQS
jgi:fatty acid desaturase